MLKISLVVLAAVLSTNVMAEEQKPWEVEVELGAIATSGNTQTTSVHTKVNVKQHLTHFRNEYIVSSLFKEDEIVQEDRTKLTEKTADKYLLSAKSAYLLMDSDLESSYLFGFASYTHDNFGAYKTYETIALGYGDWLFSNETLTWFVEAGPGYFRGEKVFSDEDVTAPYRYQKEQGALLRLATELDFKLTQTATLKQIISVETGADNTRSLSETSLAASISHSMQMKFSFAVARDSKVALGKENVDTTTSATIVYRF